ncbi:MAG: hypothetical protein WCT07_01605 [Candidatus Paceibacterota bacterium]|jgi:hypothetical protein
METSDHGKQIPVAGFVRGKKETKDGNFKFRVLHQWFLVPKGSTFAKAVILAKTAIVVYELTNKKYPRILSVKTNYTGEELRDATLYSPPKTDA